MKIAVLYSLVLRNISEQDEEVFDKWDEAKETIKLIKPVKIATFFFPAL